MSEHKEPIPSMIYNSAVGGHLTTSQQIIDENLNREQNDINQETVGSVPYNSTNPNGMGRIVLKKNGNFKEVVEAQTNGNTIFVIKYDFTLTSNVTIPANCVLEFDGGSVSGGTVLLNNTLLTGEPRLSVVINGTIANKEVFIEWFGVISEYNNANCASNNTIFNNYIIPSIENLNVGSLENNCMLSMKVNTVITFSEPIVFSGKYNLNLCGTFAYDGAFNTTAITVGNDSGRCRNMNYYISNVTSYNELQKAEAYYNVEEVKEYIGVCFKNIDTSSIKIDRIMYFVTCLKLYGHGDTFQLNSIYIGGIFGAFCYGILMMSDDIGEKTGWITSNTFIGGTVQPNNADKFRQDGRCIGVFFNAVGYWYSNCNSFFNTSFENCSIGAKFVRTGSSLLFGVRFELVYTNYISDSYSYGNVIIPSYIHLLDSTPGVSNGFYGLSELFGGSKILKEGKVIFKDWVAQNFMTCIPDDIMPVLGGLGYGHFVSGIIVDIVSDTNNVWIKSNVEATFVAYILVDGGSNQYITEELSHYVNSTGNISVSNNTKYLICTKRAKYWNISFNKTNVSRVFVGVFNQASQVTVDELCFRGCGVELSKDVKVDSNIKNTVIEFPLSSLNVAVAYGGMTDFTLDIRNDIFSGLGVGSTTTITIPSGMTLKFNGGKITGGGKIDINGAKVLPDYNAFADNAQFTILGMPAAGTLYWQNGKPTWSDGTNWVDALGNPITTVYPKVIGTPTAGNLAKFNSTDSHDIEDAGVAPQV